MADKKGPEEHKRTDTDHAKTANPSAKDHEGKPSAPAPAESAPAKASTTSTAEDTAKAPVAAKSADDKAGTPAAKAAKAPAAGEKPAVPPRPGKTAQPASATAEPAKTDSASKPADATSQGSATSMPKVSAAKSSSPPGTDTKTASTPASTAPSTASAAAAPPPPRRGGFLPLLLGGACAALIGFAAAYYLLPQLGLIPATDDGNAELTALIDEQAQRITVLQQRLDETPPTPEVPDISGLEAEQQQFQQRLDALAAKIDDFATHLDTFASQPAGSTGASIPSRQLSELREALDAQATRIDALSAQARQREAAEHTLAQQDLRRSALAHIRSALDNGTSFVPALADLEHTGISAPDSLQTVAASGVLTQTELHERFAPAARAALAAARDSKTDGDGGGFWAFMSDQVGLRSLERREGPGADAVLSRAEDDLRHGKLESALSEIAALPASAQAELADWAAMAHARMQALAAYDMLAAKLN